LNDNIKPQFMLIDFLEKLNNGDKFSRDDVEINYSKIQPFIDLLYTVDNFPVDHSDENIYCFIDFKRKHFDKYHIQDIADIVINYNKNIEPYTGDPVKIITDYTNDKSNSSKHISWIVDDYASGQSCSDSKKIKQLIWENAIKEKKYSEEVLTEKILKYATNIKYRKEIAEIIIDIKRYENFHIEIHNIVKENKLPRRDDEAYQIISSYEPYELTHCISYEMAIRNKDVQTTLEKIKALTLLNRELFRADILHKNDSAPFYILEMEEQREKILKILESLQVKLKIDFDTSSLIEIQTELFRLITEYTILLEEDYYMIHDRKEIVPEGMEGIFKEPNHYEPDGELNQYMDKAIETSIRNAYDVSPRYKDNFTFKDGYAIYQASYEDSKEYDINKIFPNFKRPMREFNQTQVAFNMSLPKDEIIAYIEKIKDDYDNKNTSYKTLSQLLYGDDTRAEDKLNHKQKERYADDFFIYDYYTQSDDEHETKLELIQKKLSQYHGMKIEISQNKYQYIDYDEAQIKINTPKTKSNSNSFADIAKSFKEHEHIIHHIETLSIIQERYDILKKAIDNKKYKKLIHYK